MAEITPRISGEPPPTAERRAGERGQTPGEVIDAALRHDLAVPDQRGERPVVPVFDLGTGPRPGIELTSNRALHEALDEGVDLDLRR